MTAHPSELALERGGAAVDAHVAACERCQARAQAAREVTDTFERRVLPATLPAIRARVGRKQVRWRLWIGLPAIAAVGLAFFVGVHSRDALDTTKPYFGTKGAPVLYAGALEIVVKRASVVKPLEPGEKLHAGDNLRFVYRGERSRHVELRIVERSGEALLFYPERGSAPLMHPGEALPGAAIVDNQARAEELILRLSDRPFDTADAGAAAETHHIRLEKE